MAAGTGEEIDWQSTLVHLVTARVHTRAVSLRGSFGTVGGDELQLMNREHQRFHRLYRLIDSCGNGFPLTFRNDQLSVT